MEQAAGHALPLCLECRGGIRDWRTIIGRVARKAVSLREILLPARASKSFQDLLKYRLLFPLSPAPPTPPPEFLMLRSGLGPENLHLQQVPGGCYAAGPQTT